MHGTPSKKGVSFGHSVSMPVPRARADGLPGPRRALSRTTTGAATPGERLLSRRATPSVQVDSSTPFSGFQTLPIAEVGNLCPSSLPNFRLEESCRLLLAVLRRN